MANGLLCPACNKPVEDGVRIRDQFWHHECAARMISEEAEAAVEASQVKPAKPRSRAWGCGVLALQIGLVVVFSVAGLIAGSMIGVAGGFVLAVWLEYEIKLLSGNEINWLHWVLAAIGGIIGAFPGVGRGFITALEFLGGAELENANPKHGQGKR